MENSAKPEKLHVSITSGTVIKIIFIIVLFWFIYAVGDIILAIFISIVISSAIDPLVKAWQQKGLPRILGVIIIFVILLGVLALIIALLVPPIREQITELSESLPSLFDKFQQLQQTTGEINVVESIEGFFNAMSRGLVTAGGGVFGALGSVVGGIIAVITILVLSFYMSAREGAFLNFIRAVTPAKHRSYAVDLTKRIQSKMGAWLRGQIILGLIVGFLIWVGLRIIGVEYALVLAIIAGVFELVPIIGPIISAIPALFLAFTQEPTLAIWVLILFVLVQQLENHLIVPKVMQKAVGLSPIIVIIVILVGAKLGGVLGAILAVPAATALAVFLKDFTQRGRDREAGCSGPEPSFKSPVKM